MRKKPIQAIPSESVTSQAKSAKPQRLVPPPLLLPAINAPSRGSFANRNSDGVLEDSDSTSGVDSHGLVHSEVGQVVTDANIITQVVLISALSIDANRFAPREIYSDNTLQSLATSLEKNGQRDPVHVIPNPAKPGRYIIGDGWTRVQAIRMRDILGLQVKAIIHDEFTEEDIAWFGYSQNEEREPHTDYDKACFYMKWRGEGWDWETISHKTGVPVNSLYPYTNYSKLDPDILYYAKNYPKKVTVNVITQLARLISADKPADQVLSICKSFVEDDASIASLRERIDSILNKTTKRSTKSSLLFQKRYKSANFKQRTDGDIEIRARIPKSQQEAFNEAMDQLLSRFCEETESDENQDTAGTQTS